MKFYDCVTAPSPRRVRIFLAEKGLTVPTVQVDLRNGEQFTPAGVPRPQSRLHGSGTRTR
jgi:glutathione S-transferase